MSYRKKNARIAGAIYLMLVVLGIISLLLVPSQLYVWDDPLATMQNIKAGESLFRVGIASGLLAFLVYLILPLVLYKLLVPVHKTAAVLMVALAVASVPISFANTSHQFEILRLISGDTYLEVYNQGLLASKVMGHLLAYNDGNLIAQLFWGTWLFPFGYLVLKSRFLPKLLGGLLILGSVGYTIDFLARILWPEYKALAIADYITLPASLGEIGTCLWLLILGVKETPSATIGDVPDDL